MAKVLGSDVTLNFTASELPILCARSIQFDINIDMIETSITGNGVYRSYISGAVDWSGSIEGLSFLLNGTTAEPTIETLYSTLLAGDPVYISWYEQDVNAQYYLRKTGEAYVNTISEISSFDNVVTFNATFRGTGSITIETGQI